MTATLQPMPFIPAIKKATLNAKASTEAELVSWCKSSKMLFAQGPLQTVGDPHLPLFPARRGYAYSHRRINAMIHQVFGIRHSHIVFRWG
jgi:hypothetical protein